jgi:hypothetical protein
METDEKQAKPTRFEKIWTLVGAAVIAGLIISIITDPRGR